MMSILKICVISILLTIIYLVFSVSLSNLIFYNQSNGSLIKVKNKIIGSKLIGQYFQSNIYFHGRPEPNNYKNNISGSSNFPYYSQELLNTISSNYNLFIKNNENKEPDLNIISESASGLDPHITYEGALSQVARISKNSNLSKEEIIKIIDKKSIPRIFGLFGKKIVNVLELNLELSNIYAKKIRPWWSTKTNC